MKLGVYNDKRAALKKFEEDPRQVLTAVVTFRIHMSQLEEILLGIKSQSLDNDTHEFPQRAADTETAWINVRRRLQKTAMALTTWSDRTPRSG